MDGMQQPIRRPGGLMAGQQGINSAGPEKPTPAPALEQQAEQNGDDEMEAVFKAASSAAFRAAMKAAKEVVAKKPAQDNKKATTPDGQKPAQETETQAQPPGEATKPERSKGYINWKLELSLPRKKFDFVIPGLKAGNVGVLVAPGSTGKSWWLLQAAVSIAAGIDAWGLFGGVSPTSGPVLLILAEDDHDVLTDRMKVLFETRPELFTDSMLENLHTKPVHGKNWSLGTWDRTKYARSEQAEELRQDIDILKPRLVGLDTFNRCLGGIDENDNAAIGRVVADIESLIYGQTGTAVLIAHHTTKFAAANGQGNIQQAARGASALTDNARFQANMVTMTDAQFEDFDIGEDEQRMWVQMSFPKANYIAPLEPVWLHREDGGLLIASVDGPQKALNPTPAKNGNGKGKGSLPVGKGNGGSGGRTSQKPDTRGDELDARITREQGDW